MGTWGLSARLAGCALGLCVLGVEIVAAQDSDGIYAVNRQDFEARQRRVAPPAAAPTAMVRPNVPSGSPTLRLPSLPGARARAAAPPPPAATVPNPGGLQIVRWVLGADNRMIPEVTVRPLRDGEVGAGAGQRPNATIVRRAAPAANQGADVNARRGVSGEEAADMEMPGGPRAFCVRTCDGFYFPAGPAISSGDGRRAQQFYCEQTCPGAQVQLYTLDRNGTIEDAVGPARRAYSALPTAFRFRERLDAACTCSGGQATNGLARMPVTHDFTLRPGDVVVTDQGVRVFRGASRFPYRDSDFADARSYGRLPADVQRRVAEIQAGIAARETGHAAPVARLGTTRAGRLPLETASLPRGAGSVRDDGVRVIDIGRTAPGQISR